MARTIATSFAMIIFQYFDLASFLDCKEISCWWERSEYSPVKIFTICKKNSEKITVRKKILNVTSRRT